MQQAISEDWVKTHLPQKNALRTNYPIGVVRDNNQHSSPLEISTVQMRVLSEFPP